jgi:hypothetical protein
MFNRKGEKAEEGTRKTKEEIKPSLSLLSGY